MSDAATPTPPPAATSKPPGLLAVFLISLASSLIAIGAVALARMAWQRRSQPRALPEGESAFGWVERE